MKFSQNILRTYMHLLHVKFSKFSFTVKLSTKKKQKYILAWSKVKEHIINPC